MTNDFLSVYPEFRNPRSIRHKAIGKNMFMAWEHGRKFENDQCVKKLLHMYNPDYFIDANECAAAIKLRIES